MNTSMSCPKWCDQEHIGDLGADPVHQRLGDPVPVVMMNRHLDSHSKVQHLIEACDLDLVVYQNVGDDSVWVALVDGEYQRQRLEISLESARRLLHNLETLLSSTGS